MYYYEDGQKYYGQWKDGIKEGRGIKFLILLGIMYYPDGDKFDGEWRSGTTYRGI